MSAVIERSPDAIPDPENPYTSASSRACVTLKETRSAIVSSAFWPLSNFNRAFGFYILLCGQMAIGLRGDLS